MMSFYEYLAKNDPVVSAFYHRTHSDVEEEAFHRGQWYGGWSLLYALYHLLEEGVTDGEQIAGQLAAELTALKCSRLPRDFAIALERERRISDEGGRPDGE